MIAFRNYLVVVPLFKVDERIAGGSRGLIGRLKSSDIQTDVYLIGIAVENATEVRDCFETLLQSGLTYNERSGSSDDFTVVAKEGIWWTVPWLVNNRDGCWFIADVEAPV